MSTEGCFLSNCRGENSILLSSPASEAMTRNTFKYRTSFKKKKSSSVWALSVLICKQRYKFNLKIKALGFYNKILNVLKNAIKISGEHH